MALHIGKIIGRRVRASGVDKREFARRMNLTARQLHDLLKSNSVDTELLGRVSRELMYDFFAHYKTQVSHSIISVPVEKNILDELAAIRREIEMLTVQNGYLRELLQLQEILPEKNKTKKRSGVRKISPNNNSVKQTNKTKPNKSGLRKTA
jgi:hypothetical protein